jgi:glucose-6-phosphate 1-dehydrogenase
MAAKPSDAIVFFGATGEMTLTKHESNVRPPYRRQLGDALRGVGELYGPDDIVDAQRRIVEPILDNTVYPYHPGTWGPEEAQALIGADGPWRNPNIAAEPFT